jgi:hypothetical protein
LSNIRPDTLCVRPLSDAQIPAFVGIFLVYETAPHQR